jgi:putative membrane protein
MKIIQKHLQRAGKVGSNFILCLLIATFIMNCSNKDDDAIQMPAAVDQEFITKASYGNLSEADAGSLASTKGASEGVRMFGSMMVSDHGTAQAELKNIANRLKGNYPEGPDSAHVAIKQALMNLSGISFDTTYIHGQVMDHDKTIVLFESEISNGRDSSLKSYATRYLPTIKMHRMMADSLWQALKQP